MVSLLGDSAEDRRQNVQTANIIITSGPVLPECQIEFVKNLGLGVYRENSLDANFRLQRTKYFN